MNKLFIPLILLLLIASSCSKNAQESLNSSDTLGDGQILRDQVILTTKPNNFCDGHECPDGIVLVKTSDKEITCAGISKSTSEVLVSKNCTTSETDLNIQTTDGKIINVTLIEDELTNEFDDKVLKLTLENELTTTSIISTPDADNRNVKLFHFNELGKLQSQDCELTYASLAYSNSFNNESQLLNIKNCDNVKEGALISQNGNSIGFLTKKHDEIELYEGVSLDGESHNINILTKIDSVSLTLESEDAFILGYLAVSYPLNDADNLQEIIEFNQHIFQFKTTLNCYKNLSIESEDKIYNIVFNNKLLEFNEDTSLKDTTLAYYFKKSRMSLPVLSPLNQKYKDYNFYKYTGDLIKLEKVYVRNPLNNNQILFVNFELPKENGRFVKIERCK